MTFATPLGLLALLALPVIVAIHLFRRRFPVRQVAGLFLWQDPRQTPVEGRRVDRLPITPSLILELLAALGLALILAGARLSSSGVQQHLVVLLDDSASMAAVNAAGESARDRAVGRVLQEIDRLGAAARVTLVTSGERPFVIAGPGAYAVEARPALERWTPTAAHHPLALGIRLARELAGRDGRVMVVSDMTPAARGEAELTGALWAAVGEPLANVGIVAADRTLAPDEGRGVISVTLGNYGESTTRRTLTVTAGGQPVVAREVELPAGVSSMTIPLPPGLPPARVELSPDALARDNAVILSEPRPRTVGVENRLPEGRGREALSRALDALAGVTRADQGHLAFVESGDLAGASPAGRWRAAFGRPPAARGGAARDFVGPFLLEKRHSLLLGVTLNGVVWTGAAPLASASAHPLVSASDQVLIGRLADGGGADPVVLFNLDLERTNLIRSPDWPILVSNLVEMRRGALPGPERWNYRAGEWVRVRLGRDPQGPLRYRCEGIERDLPPGRHLEFIAPAPGGLLQILEGDSVIFEMGVNFLDEGEADLQPRSSADHGSLTEIPALRAEGGAPSDPLFWILLTIAGMAIVANWWILSPVRVRA